MRREPALHNVLLTLVADRLSGDVPLSGDERFGRAVDGGATVVPRHRPGKITLDPGCSGIRKSGGRYIHARG
ncbi:hypothetical protein ACQRWP_19275 [Micromonospora trifolii]|uniref:hypothetical protein n=1 Tax=Micromonospora trifolii TaxID=2911208 RepID=UPI003D2EFEFF